MHSFITSAIAFITPLSRIFKRGRQNEIGWHVVIEYRYDVPFKFTGKIDKLTFKLEP